MIKLSKKDIEDIEKLTGLNNVPTIPSSLIYYFYKDGEELKVDLMEETISHRYTHIEDTIETPFHWLKSLTDIFERLKND